MTVALSSFMVIPSVAAYTGTNQEPINVWDVSHGWSHIDYVVTHNGNPSIRCTSSISNYIAETDGAWKATTPGDHIYLSCYAKTDTWANPVGEASGSWFGFDFYIEGNITVSEVTYEVSGIAILYEESELQAGHPTQDELGGTDTNVYGYSINGESGMTQVNGSLIHTPFNVDWRKLTWDFIVPSTEFQYIWTDADGQVTGDVYELNENATIRKKKVNWSAWITFITSLITWASYAVYHA